VRGAAAFHFCPCLAVSLQKLPQLGAVRAAAVRFCPCLAGSGSSQSTRSKHRSLTLGDLS